MTESAENIIKNINKDLDGAVTKGVDFTRANLHTSRFMLIQMMSFIFFNNRKEDRKLSHSMSKMKDGAYVASYISNRGYEVQLFINDKVVGNQYELYFEKRRQSDGV